MLTKLSCSTSSAQSLRLVIRTATANSFGADSRYSSAKARSSLRAQRTSRPAMRSGDMGCTESGAAVVLVLAPVDVFASRVAIDHAAQDEQQIGEAVEVALPERGHLFRAGEAHHPALRAAAHGACDMAQRRGARSAGQDELFQRRQLCVEAVEQLFQAQDVRLADAAVTRNAELAPEVEEFVLDVGQAVAHRVRQRLGEQHADRAVQLVDRADRLDARAVLDHARSVAETGGAGVPGARIDPAKAMSHGVSLVPVDYMRLIRFGAWIG